MLYALQSPLLLVLFILCFTFFLLWHFFSSGCILPSLELSQTLPSCFFIHKGSLVQAVLTLLLFSFLSLNPIMQIYWDIIPSVSSGSLNFAGFFLSFPQSCYAGILGHHPFCDCTEFHWAPIYRHTKISSVCTGSYFTVIIGIRINHIHFNKIKQGTRQKE